jgi:oligopeptide transport system ATP-binding protein
MTQTLLHGEGITKHFKVAKAPLFGGAASWVKAVDGVDFSVNEHETLSIVGESGSGKTTLAKMVLLLERPTSGTIFYDDKDLAHLSKAEFREYRRNVQAVFQDPFSSLSPRMLVRSIVGEPLEIQGAMSKQEIKDRIAEVLQQVGLSANFGDRHPHELSGGQRQRVALARAIGPSPRHIVLDEPVAALDVSIRNQIVNLLKDLQEQFGISYLIISHDLVTVRHLSHEVAVLYAGKVMERTGAKDLFGEPLHPYTKALLSAAVPPRRGEQREGIVLSGEVPNPLNPPSGCRFHPRCPHAMPKCSQVEPRLQEIAPGRKVACFLYSDD